MTTIQMLNRLSYTWTIVLIVLSYSAQVAVGQEYMTLPRAISIGLENNYSLKIAEQYIAIADNNDTWAKAGRTPTIDLTGSFGNSITQNNNPASFIQGAYYSGSLSAGLTGSYTLYAGGRIKIAKEQLGLAAANERLARESEVHDLMKNIWQQYYSVLFEKERLTVLEQSLDLSRSRLAYERIRRDFGTSNTYSIVQFENALMADSINVVSQEQQVEVALRKFYDVLDMDYEPDFVYEERLSVTDEVLDAEQLKQLMSESSYTLKSLEMISAVSSLNTKLARAARQPTVALTGNLSFTENGFKLWQENDMTGEPFPFVLGNQVTGGVGATLSYNLYDGGVRSTDIESAQMQEVADRMTVEQARANLLSQLDLLVTNYQNQRDLLQLSDEQIQLAQQNIDITEERFKTGVVSSLDYRAVQLQYINAAFAKVSAIYNLLLTKSEVDYLVGRFDY